MSTSKETKELHTYPSVTICHVFKDEKNIAMDIFNEGTKAFADTSRCCAKESKPFSDLLAQFENQGGSPKVLFEELEKHAWDLTDLLQVL